MATQQIVIARYNEDISWAEGLPALVYNKGTTLTTSLPVRALPNIGRESHTYLHHIVHEWNHLADVTLFAQGRTNDHLPPGAEAGHFFDPTHDIVVPRLVNCHEWNEAGQLQHWGVWKERFDAGKLEPSRWTFVDWFREYVGVDPVALGALAYTPGAIFSVTRECIHSRSRADYERLLSTVCHHVDPEEAYYLERAWLYLFSAKSPRIRFLSA